MSIAEWKFTINCSCESSRHLLATFSTTKRYCNVATLLSPLSQWRAERRPPFDVCEMQFPYYSCSTLHPISPPGSFTLLSLCLLYVSWKFYTQMTSWKRNTAKFANLQVDRSQNPSLSENKNFALQPLTRRALNSNAKQHMDMSTKSNPTQCFPLTSEPKPANSSPNQTAWPLPLPLFFCELPHLDGIALACFLYIRALVQGWVAGW